MYYCLAAGKTSYYEKDEDDSDKTPGFCATGRTVHSSANNYRYNCPSYSLANCAGCNLQVHYQGWGHASVTVEFPYGVSDGRGPGFEDGDNNDPHAPGPWSCSTDTCDYQRWDLSINMGTGSDKDLFEISVSNDLENWISLGRGYGGEAHKGPGFSGNCCVNDTDYCGGDSKYRCMGILSGDTLTYKFDFKGTPAEGGTFRFVRVANVGVWWNTTGNKKYLSGPEMGNLRAYYQPADCKWVSQVVTPSGQNKAWLARVDKSSTYVTADGHTYYDDWPPFGGVIPPDPVHNPAVWDSKEWEGRQPLFEEAPDMENYEIPYQARAGVPFASEDNDPAENEKNGPGVGESRVKQLFAESYGTWKWSQVGKCSEGSGTAGVDKGGAPCVRDDCPDGSCNEKDTFCTLKDDAACEVAECPVGICNNQGRCSGGAKELCCPDAWGVCGIKLETQEEQNKYGTGTFGICSAGSAGKGYCQTNDCGPGECVHSDGEDYKCNNDSEGMTGKFCCSKLEPKSDAECEDLMTAYCQGGSNDGKFCEIDNCMNGSCEWVESRYVASAEYMWSSPDTQCRKTYSATSFVFVTEREDADNPDTDFCAVPPRVGNIKVNGKEAEPVVLLKGGFATLTFTSHIDPNQLPITGYKVDWGDGTKTVASGIKINQNQSPDNPHTFYHYYNYWDIKSKENSTDLDITCKLCENFAGLTAAQCEKVGLLGASICSLTPKVQVQDNWNWCNATTGEFNQGYYNNFCNIMIDAYTEFGNKIYITER